MKKTDKERVREMLRVGWREWLINLGCGVLSAFAIYVFVVIVLLLGQAATGGK